MPPESSQPIVLRSVPPNAPSGNRSVPAHRPRHPPAKSVGLFDGRSYKRTFYTAPQSVTSLVAALLEPGVIVGVFLGVSAWFDEPILRPDLADAHFNLAIAYARLGLGEEAEREHRLAIELRGLPPAEPR